MRFGNPIDKNLSPDRRLRAPGPRPPARRAAMTPPAGRPGMTLVELLVVIVLVTVLVTTAIPVLSPGGDARKLREASRAINTYLASAQARAVETGRPCGVQLNRLSLRTQNWRDNSVVTSMNLVEVPPAYTGFDEGSVARVGVVETNGRGIGLRQLGLQFLNYVDAVVTDTDLLPAGYDEDLLPERFLRVGDRVEIAGATYELVSPTYYGQLWSPIGGFGSGQFAIAQQPNVLFPAPYAIPVSIQDALPPPAGAAPNEDEQAAELLPGQMPADRRPQPITYLARLIDAGDPAERLIVDPGENRGTQWPVRPVNLPLTHDRDGNALPGPEAIALIDPEPVPPYWTEPRPYRVLRKPAPATGAPLELPAGIAIDLQASRILGGDANDQLYWPTDHAVSPSVTDFNVVTEPIVVMFAPDGSLQRVTGADGVDGSGILSGSLALCVGRRELMPAEPSDARNAAAYNDPYNPRSAEGLAAAEQEELRNQYNWLRTDTRWVVIGSRSGSIATVSNTTRESADEGNLLAQQLDDALENAYARAKVGGR